MPIPPSSGKRIGHLKNPAASAIPTVIMHANSVVSQIAADRFRGLRVKAIVEIQLPAVFFQSCRHAPCPIQGILVSADCSGIRFQHAGMTIVL
jgi:hypothetical protein